MRRYPWTDAAVKDPTRFLYGSKPGTGIVEIVGNILAMAVAEELTAEALFSNPLEEPQRCPSRLMGEALANQYIQKAFVSITGKLPSAPAGSGARYPLVIPAALKLQGFKLAPWLPEDVRNGIDVDGLTPCINIPLT